MLARYNHSSRNIPGSGLPIYPSTDYIEQLRDDMLGLPYTWLCPSGQGIPFQFQFGVAAVTGFDLVSPDDGTVISLGSSIDTITLTTGNKLHTYKGDSGSESDGVWYYRITFFGGATAVSDIFQVGGCDSDNSMLLTWWDSKEYNGGIYYGEDGAAFKNKMWLNTDFARPRLNYREESVVEGYGNPYPLYQNTEDLYVVDMRTCASQIGVLARVANHDNITITYPGLAAEIPINTFRITDTGEKSDALAITELTFRREFMENNTLSFIL